MTFSPVIPTGGLAGWVFLTKTAEEQKEAQSQTPGIKRLTEDFRQRIGDIKSAEALVEDRNLLTVALGAFGLDDDINNKFFIQKILEEGTSDPDALANKLADKRYLEFSDAFGFGSNTGARTGLSSFSGTIIDAFETRSFEVSVGDIDEDMRLALGLERDLGKITEKDTTNDTKWFSVLGTPPLRRIFEVALGLPTSFGTLSIDRQLETMKERSLSQFGSEDLSDLGTQQNRENLIQKFLLRSQIEQTSNLLGDASVALSLLQNSNS